MYISHMRDEGDKLLEVDRRTGRRSRGASGGPAEIYHFKQSGRANWGKLDAAIARVEAARAAGLRITADMYTYPASSTGLDADLPAWAMEGGHDAFIARLKDPATARPADRRSCARASGSTISRRCATGCCWSGSRMQRSSR